MKELASKIFSTWISFKTNGYWNICTTFFLFFPGRSISPHPWGEMVSGMGRDGLGVHLAPWKCMELYYQYCAMCDTEGNGLNNRDRSMYAGILCTDIRTFFQILGSITFIWTQLSTAGNRGDLNQTFIYSKIILQYNCSIDPDHLSCNQCICCWCSTEMILHKRQWYITFGS